MPGFKRPTAKKLRMDRWSRWPPPPPNSFSMDMEKKTSGEKKSSVPKNPLGVMPSTVNSRPLT